jgi:hypothetical protein
MGVYAENVIGLRGANPSLHRCSRNHFLSISIKHANSIVTISNLAFILAKEFGVTVTRPYGNELTLYYKEVGGLMNAINCIKLSRLCNFFTRDYRATKFG